MNKSAFTLAELLIVVAIIAVLTGIGLPVFSNQLEKSREAKDLANVRSAYAEMMVAANAEDHNAKYNGIVMYDETEKVYSIKVLLKQRKEDWQYETDLTVAGISKKDHYGTKWLNKPDGETNSYCIVAYDPASNTTVLDWSGGKLNTLFEIVGFGKGCMGQVISTSYSGSHFGITPSMKKTDGYVLEPGKTYQFSFTYDPLKNANGTMLLPSATILYDANEVLKMDTGTLKYSTVDSVKNNGSYGSINYKFTENPDGTVTYTASFTTPTGSDKYYFHQNFKGFNAKTGADVNFVNFTDLDKVEASKQQIKDTWQFIELN
ncbi:MAG: prepilin-type N-terminal cleavage/methylation domain-containing protein [Erysipelotrichaceae bacterium]|nr:prepilin-type N-terminal cleavage/methylation domain-containing protein [Erysipelotrichaceae bacterium]